MSTPPTAGPTLISARQAAVILAEAGLTREQSRRLLQAGFAGAGMRTSSALLYDGARVFELALRPHVEVTEQASGREIFVARAGEARPLNLEQTRDEQLAALRQDWDIAPLTRVWLRCSIATHGFVPFVATVSGYVAAGADLTGVRVDTAAARAAGQPRPQGDRGCSRLELAEPGSWFEEYAGRRFPTGKGGAWVLREVS